MTPDNVVEKIEEKIGDDYLALRKQNEKRYYVEIEAASIVEAVQFVYQELEGRLATITGRDTEAGIQLLYHFGFESGGFFVTLRIILDHESPRVDSIHEVIPGAAYVEREISDFLGVKVENISDSSKFLKFDGLPDDHYPLRQGGEEPKNE